MNHSTKFSNLLEIKHKGKLVPPTKLLALDPGETTGWAVFINGELKEWGQAPTKEDWNVIYNLFNQVDPDAVIFENYRVYQHKLERHSFSEVYTLRLVGVIEFLCSVIFGIPHFNQMAVQAKGFVTDERLKGWGYYQSGQKHARDAIRHGCYFLLVNKEAEQYVKKDTK